MEAEIPPENNFEKNFSKENNISINSNQILIEKELEYEKVPEQEQEKNIPINMPSSEQFLELSLINEIKQTINKLEFNCENKMGESLIEDRCRILSYALILVDVYQKPKSNLIFPYAKLGEAYYDIKYYEQAKEHIENAIRCYSEIKLYKTALALAERALLQNKALFPEDDISNIELYDIIYTCEKNLNNYSNAIENLKILYNHYAKIYDENCEKCINCIKELASLYESDEKYKESLDNYLKYFKLIEESELANKNKIKEIYDTAIKIGELYAKLEEYQQAYDFLINVDKNYNNGYNRTDKEKFVYQQLLCSLASFLGDEIYLEELLNLESFLIQCNKNKKGLLRKTYLNIGHIYKKNNELDRSFSYFRKALNYANKENDVQLVQEINKLIKEIEKEKKYNEIKGIK